MIDNFALLVSHGLMMIAAFLLMRRRDLDTETTLPAPSPPTPGAPPRA